jgi:hypothetical protein
MAVPQRKPISQKGKRSLKTKICLKLREFIEQIFKYFGIKLTLVTFFKS